MRVESVRVFIISNKIAFNKINRKNVFNIMIIRTQTTNSTT